MKKLLLLVFLLLMLTSSTVASTQTQTDLCLLRLTPYVDIVADAGLYPSVYLAQALLETGHCASFAIQYNNYWGIKCQTGYCFSKNTWEIYDSQLWQGPLMFQVFDSPREGVCAYRDKILYQKAYRGVNKASREAYIDSLARVWATDKKYAGKIKDIIGRYNLTRFDRP